MTSKTTAPTASAAAVVAPSTSGSTTTSGSSTPSAATAAASAAASAPAPAPAAPRPKPMSWAAAVGSGAASSAAIITTTRPAQSSSNQQPGSGSGAAQQPQQQQPQPQQGGSSNNNTATPQQQQQQQGGGKPSQPPYGGGGNQQKTSHGQLGFRATGNDAQNASSQQQQQRQQAAGGSRRTSMPPQQQQQQQQQQQAAPQQQPVASTQQLPPTQQPQASSQGVTYKNAGPRRHQQTPSGYSAAAASAIASTTANASQTAQNDTTVAPIQFGSIGQHQQQQQQQQPQSQPQQYTGGYQQQQQPQQQPRPWRGQGQPHYRHGSNASAQGGPRPSHYQQHSQPQSQHDTLPATPQQGQQGQQPYHMRARTSIDNAQIAGGSEPNQNQQINPVYLQSQQPSSSTGGQFRPPYNNQHRQSRDGRSHSVSQQQQQQQQHAAHSAGPRPPVNAAQTLPPAPQPTQQQQQQQPQGAVMITPGPGGAQPGQQMYVPYYPTPGAQMQPQFYPQMYQFNGQYMVAAGQYMVPYPMGPMQTMPGMPASSMPTTGAYPMGTQQIQAPVDASSSSTAASAVAPNGTLPVPTQQQSQPQPQPLPVIGTPVMQQPVPMPQTQHYGTPQSQPHVHQHQQQVPVHHQHVPGTPVQQPVLPSAALSPSAAGRSVAAPVFTPKAKSGAIRIKDPNSGANIELAQLAGSTKQSQTPSASITPANGASVSPAIQPSASTAAATTVSAAATTPAIVPSENAFTAKSQSQSSAAITVTPTPPPPAAAAAAAATTPVVVASAAGANEPAVDFKIRDNKSRAIKIVNPAEQKRIEEEQAAAAQKKAEEEEALKKKKEEEEAAEAKRKAEEEEANKKKAAEEEEARKKKAAEEAEAEAKRKSAEEAAAASKKKADEEEAAIQLAGQAAAKALQTPLQSQASSSVSSPVISSTATAPAPAPAAGSVGGMSALSGLRTPALSRAPSSINIPTVQPAHPVVFVNSVIIKALKYPSTVAETDIPKFIDNKISYNKAFLMTLKLACTAKPAGVSITDYIPSNNNRSDGPLGSSDRRGSRGITPSRTFGSMSGAGAGGITGMMGQFNTGDRKPSITASGFMSRTSSSRSSLPPTNAPLSGQGLRQTPSRRESELDSAGGRRGRGSGGRGGGRGRGSGRGGDRRGSTADAASEAAAQYVRAENAWVPLSQQAPAEETAPEVVERKVKAQLNKLTKENFMDIAAEVLKVCDLCVNFTDGRILKQVVKILYDKAVDEQQYGDMYASLVLYLVTKVSSDIIDKEFTTKDGNPLSGGLVLRRYLVLQCQHAFESGWSVQMEQPEDKVITMEDMMSDQYYHLVRAKRRGLGLAKFIGCLFINKLIRPPVIKQCLVSLLGDLENPTEELCESAIMLLKTIGSTMEKDPEMKLELDTYMMRVKHLSELKSKLPSRVRFALMDLILLREKKQWVDKSASVPMTIADLHKDEQRKKEAEQAALRSRVASSSSSGRLPKLNDQLGGRGSRPPSERRDLPTRSFTAAGGPNAPAGGRGSGTFNNPANRRADVSMFGDMSRSRAAGGAPSSNPFGALQSGSSGWKTRGQSQQQQQQSTGVVATAQNMFSMLGEDKSSDAAASEESTADSRATLGVGKDQAAPAAVAPAAPKEPLTKEKVELKVDNCIREYLQNGDVDEVRTVLDELDTDDNRKVFFGTLFIMMLERKWADTEKAADLLNTLITAPLSTPGKTLADLGRTSYDELLASVLETRVEEIEDLAIDAPNALKHAGALLVASELPLDRIVRLLAPLVELNPDEPASSKILEHYVKRFIEVSTDEDSEEGAVDGKVVVKEQIEEALAQIEAAGDAADETIEPSVSALKKILATL